MSFKKTIRRKTKAPDLEYFRLGAIAYMGYPKIADRSAGLGYPRIGCYNDLFGISQDQKRFVGMGYPNVINMWDIPKCLLAWNFWKQRDGRQ